MERDTFTFHVFHIRCHCGCFHRAQTRGSCSDAQTHAESTLSNCFFPHVIKPGAQLESYSMCGIHVLYSALCATVCHCTVRHNNITSVKPTKAHCSSYTSAIQYTDFS